MKLVARDWNVIVPGKWNQAIFTPNFLGHEVFGVRDARMEALVPLDSTGAVFRFEGLQIQPSSSSLSVAALAPRTEDFLKARDCMRKVLEILGRTPISACGFNIRYVEHEDDAGGALAGVRGTRSLAVDGALGHDPAEWKVIASYPYKEGVVNYETAYGGGPLIHAFNFHLATADQRAAVAWLQSDIGECLEFAARCMGAFYGEMPELV